MKLNLILLLGAVSAIKISENSKAVERDELPPDDILLQVVPGSGLTQNKPICTGWNSGNCITVEQLN